MDKFFADQIIRVAVPLTSAEIIDGSTVTAGVYTVRKVAPTTATLVADQALSLSDPYVVVDLTTSPVTEPTVFQLDYTLTTPDGDFDYYLNFIVAPGESTALTVGSDSFQTYFEALITADSIAGVDSFKGAPKSDQIAALKNAYDTLCTMVFTDKFAEYYDMAGLDAAALAALEAGLLKALKIAQVIEASEMLDPNSIHYKRLDGLMSETIGESSMMFRPGNINNYPITRRSMMYLRNYVVIRARLQRG